MIRNKNGFVQILAVAIIAIVAIGAYLVLSGHFDNDKGTEEPSTTISNFVVDDIAYEIQGQASSRIQILGTCASENGTNVRANTLGTNETSKVTVVGYVNDSDVWNIPSTVEYEDRTYEVVAIADNAFKGSKAETITIGSSVKTIGANSFSELQSLKELTVQGDVTTCADSFKDSGTENGAKIVISEGVTTIVENAFKGLKVCSITLPSTLISVDRSAFDAPVTSDGTVFKGWFTDVEDITSEYDFEASTTSIVLVPMIVDISDDYKEEFISYLVQFKYNEDFTSMSYELVNRNGTPDFPIPVEKPGYLFTGWYTDNTYTERYNENLPIRKDTVVYGKYVVSSAGVKALIQIEGGVGSPSIYTNEYHIGDTIGYKDEFFLNALDSIGTRDGFIFEGLYEGENLWYDNTMTTRDKLSWSRTIVQDTILKVKWTSKLYDEYDPQYIGVYSGDINPDFIGHYSNNTYDYYTYYVGTAYDTILNHGSVYRNDGTTYIDLSERGSEVSTTVSSTYTEGNKTGIQKTIIEEKGGVDGWGVASGVLSTLSGVAGALSAIPAMTPAAAIVSGICSVGSGICGIISGADNDSDQTTIIETKEKWIEYTSTNSKTLGNKIGKIEGVAITPNVGVEEGHYVTYAVIGVIDYYQIEVYDKKSNYVGTFIEGIPSTTNYEPRGITVPDKGKSLGPDLEHSFFECLPIAREKIMEDVNASPELSTKGVKITVISKETGETMIYERQPGKEFTIPENDRIFIFSSGTVYGWGTNPLDVNSPTLPAGFIKGNLGDTLKNPTKDETYYAIWKKCAAYSLIESKDDFKAIDNNPKGTYLLIKDISVNKALTKDFSGYFNGMNHKVTYTQSNATYINGFRCYGLFPFCSNANIKNVNIESTINIKDTDVEKSIYAGAISGVFGGSVSKCVIEASINISNGKDSENFDGYSYLGTIVGEINGEYCNKSSTISNCEAKGTIAAVSSYAKITHAGGIAGKIYRSNVTLNSNHVSNTTIGIYSKEANLGGFVGTIESSTVSLKNSNCDSTSFPSYCTIERRGCIHFIII